MSSVATAAATTANDPNPDMDTSAPLLQTRPGTAPLAVLLGRVTGRRGASLLVRETAARQLEQHRADWGYSKPVVALDIMWNLSFVIVSVVMVLCTLKEKTNVPIRLWICGYALQCLVHVVLVSVEYKRRRRNSRLRGADGSGGGGGEIVDDDEEEEGGNGGTVGVSWRSRLVF